MNKAEKSKQLNPLLRVLLVGVYDKESPLSSLSGCLHIIHQIWKKVVDYWKLHIIEGNTFELGTCFHAPSKTIMRRSLLEYHFPKPRDININMMPFKMSLKFDGCMLPEAVRPYWNFIKDISNDQTALMKNICYLTIQESYVTKGESQRRPGVHTETPGTIRISNENNKLVECEKGNGDSEGKIKEFLRTVHWGGPIEKEIQERKGGIYTASSIDQSCKIWDCQILRDEKTGHKLIGEHGDIEHLRVFLPAEPFLKESTRIYWITDRTPHESLPMKEGTYRQFLRLVTDQVSVWFKDHSTANPNGVIPDPKITTIVSGSKFKGDLKVVDPDTMLATVIKKISRIFK